jgi:ribosomal-protein-alanine N-acetyltransferase
MELQLQKSGTKSLFIEVAISNLAAITLYTSCGFQAAGLRKNYYDRGNGTHEDARIMRKDLAS